MNRFPWKQQEITCVHWKQRECVVMIADSMKLVLTALNTTRTGYASFTFSTNKFFSKYIYNPPRSLGSTKGKFTCRLYNKVDGNRVTYMEP